MVAVRSNLAVSSDPAVTEQQAGTMHQPKYSARLMCNARFPDGPASAASDQRTA